MKIFGQTLSGFALLTGLWAAWLWFKASKIDLRPMMQVGDDLAEIGVDLHPNAWIEAMKDTVQQSSDLNRRAALWTAVSVALSGAASATGSF